MNAVRAGTQGARKRSNLLTARIHDRELKRCAGLYLKGRLADIGCGDKPYGDLLAPFVEEHVGIDHEGTQHDRSRVDLTGTAYGIPAEDASFDSAICTAVLEHLEEPEQAIRECWRILKPGGHAVYTAPFIWHVHEEPRDFYRYSRYGLEYLFQKAGFEIVELKALSGFWTTFGVLLVYKMQSLNRGPLRWLKIADALGAVTQSVAGLTDRLDRAEQWTWMYLVVARKP